MFYHRCSETRDIKAESFCTLSKSTRHDPCAIFAHLVPIFKQILEKVPNVSTLYVLSDSPSTQYRNKTIFYILATHISDYLKVKSVAWNYSESGHGKGAPDGIGAVIKRTADRLVAQGKDISNFDSLLHELKFNCHGVYLETVDAESITEFEKQIPNILTSFSGTMKVHQATWNISNPQVVNFRRLSCNFCGLGETCSHYNLGSITLKQLNQISELPIPAKVSNTEFPEKNVLLIADVYSDSDDEAEATIHLKSRKFSLNDFVLVQYPADSGVHYVGTIVEEFPKVVESIFYSSNNTSYQYRINFMKKLPGVNTSIFVWPEQKDEEIVDESNIVFTLENPTPFRRGKFSFDYNFLGYHMK